MKKVLFLVGSLGGGGAEKVLVDTVNSMPSQEFDITVQTIFDEGIHKRELNSNVKYKSIVRIKNPLLRKAATRLVLYYLPAKYLYQRYVKDRYDYEIAFLEGVPTKIIANSDQKSVKYAWVHTNFENNFDSLHYFKDIDEYRTCYRKFDKIICVSQVAQKGFKKQIGEDFPVDVLYNLLDEKNIVKKSHEIESMYPTDKTFKLISVGRLADQKGYDRLICVAERLKATGLQFKIYIIGEGKERGNLELLITQHKVNDVVVLMGYKENPYPYIASADLFVCSSREEGFSTVVTEALILGIPVVTTECAGMKELFGDRQCGRIVDNNADALFEGLYDALKNTEKLKKYKCEAENRGKYFRIEQRMEEFLKLFDARGE